jgi:type II secretory pathway component PulF
VATGPAEPYANDKTDHAEPALVPSPVDDPALSIGNAVHLARSGKKPWTLRHMMYLIAGAAILFWLATLGMDAPVFGAILIVSAIVLAFSSIMGAGVILARRRSTRQDALLSILAIAAERGMPLATALVAFADQFQGKSYDRIMELASRLIWGNRLPEALDKSRRLVSADAILLAWVGEAAGKLPRALRMAANVRSTQLPIWTAITGRLSYILTLLLAMQGVSGFILYFVMPKLEAIFKDFGVSLPRVTVMVIEISHFLVVSGPVAFLILLFEVALLLFLPFSFLSWGNYTVPLFDRILGRRHSALILRSLALIVEGGKPIAQGLSTLTEHYPTGRVRRRLRAVETDVQQGADWIDALKRHRLINPADADVLASATKVGNLAWALLTLADTTERRLVTRLQMVIQTLFPLVVVILGMVVFVLAMAYFVPLVALITELTRT